MFLNQRIYCKVVGGLGNQLFIYSCAKALALKNKCPLILDHRYGFVNDDYGRKYLLDVFQINDHKSRWRVFFYIYFLDRIPFISQLIIPECIYIKEENNKVLKREIINNDIQSSVYLDGYWQSFKYFKDYNTEIQQSLRLKSLNLNADNESLLKLILSSNSVAVHIRRVRYKCILPLEYYKKAINKLNNKMDHLKYFIFSDDIAFCKEHFNFDTNINFVKSNEEDDGITDFYLMKQCNHFIIANSTFSWWAAWLSGDVKKVVIAPENTHIGVKGYYYPDTWIQV